MEEAFSSEFGSGLATVVLGVLATLAAMGVALLKRKLHLTDADLTLRAQDLLDKTLEANVRAAEQEDREARKARKRISGAEKELKAITGTKMDLEEIGGAVAKKALKMATESRLKSAVKGVVGKLF